MVDTVSHAMGRVIAVGLLAVGLLLIALFGLMTREKSEPTVNSTAIGPSMAEMLRIRTFPALHQINRKNVRGLQVAWAQESEDLHQIPALPNGCRTLSTSMPAPVSSGEKSVGEMESRYSKLIIQIASGEIRTKAESLGQDDLILWKRGVSL
jgi:hypothetical protein